MLFFDILPDFPPVLDPKKCRKYGQNTGFGTPKIAKNAIFDKMANFPPVFDPSQNAQKWPKMPFFDPPKNPRQFLTSKFSVFFDFTHKLKMTPFL
jgi:hypothetical protein